MGRFIQDNDLAQLEQLHPVLRRMAMQAVQRLPFDCFVIFTHRTVAQQQALFAQGRTRPGNIVTNMDGVRRKSRHNFLPSLAIDLAPASVIATGVWRDTAETRRQFAEIANAMKVVAREMLVEDYEWGGDWKMRDLPHHELTRNP